MTQNSCKAHVIALILFFSLLSLLACNGSSPSKKASVSEMLIGQIASGDQTQAYTALFLLAHMVLVDADIEKLNQLYEKEAHRVKKLHLAYVLASRTHEFKYIEAFIHLYPEGEAQADLWNTPRDHSRYVCVSSPLSNQLARFAGYDLENLNDLALNKLVSGYPFADGADAESLVALITSLYQQSPKRVLNALSRQNVDFSAYGIE